MIEYSQNIIFRRGLIFIPLLYFFLISPQGFGQSNDHSAYGVSVPKVITPNGDGINDLWIIQGLENYPNHKIELYNRWGNLIYEGSIESEPFDATAMVEVKRKKLERQDLPDGTYSYLITLEPDSGKKIKGFLELIR
jgi:gliding motility-associated-like protein